MDPYRLLWLLERLGLAAVGATGVGVTQGAIQFGLPVWGMSAVTMGALMVLASVLGDAPPGPPVG